MWRHFGVMNLSKNIDVLLLMKGGLIDSWSSIETVQQFYLKTSDANETKAVEMLDRLMEEGLVQEGNSAKF